MPARIKPLKSIVTPGISVRNSVSSSTRPLKEAALTTMLAPDYIAHVPPRDAWGHDYDYHIQLDNLMGGRVMLIRSPGADGVFADDTYTFAPFITTHYRADIVWADGLFVRWPVGLDTYGRSP